MCRLKIKNLLGLVRRAEPGEIFEGVEDDAGGVVTT